MRWHWPLLYVLAVIALAAWTDFGGAANYLTAHLR